MTLIKFGGTIEQVVSSSPDGKMTTTINKLSDEKSFKDASDVGSLSILTSYFKPAVDQVKAWVNGKK